MYLDVKETVWTRYYIRDIEEQEVLQKLKNGEHLWDISDNIESDIMLDTIEEIEVGDNMGFATKEFYNDKGELLWDNIKTE